MNLFHFIQKYVIDKIDFGTISILFCLMGVVAGFNDLGYFDKLAGKLVQSAKSLKILMLILVLSNFFLSMLVTNDVSLIVMIPFTIQIFHNIQRNDKLIKTTVLETIAANLGSMLTPIGNPQNVYLYQHYHMSPGFFFKTVFPYALLSFLLLCLLTATDKNRGDTIILPEFAFRGQKPISAKAKKEKTTAYTLLFLLCILCVLGFIPSYVNFLIVSVVLFLCNKKLFRQINYGLLIKFIFLFLLIGNLADISWINSKLKMLTNGHEFLLGFSLSQFLSNVPTAIALSGFTHNGAELLLGVNVGGLGTLIASMASMISLDFYTKAIEADKKKYILQFSVYNLLFIVILFSFFLLSAR